MVRTLFAMLLAALLAGRAGATSRETPAAHNPTPPGDMLGAGTTAPARVAGRAVVSEDLIRMRRERNPELTRVTQRL